MKTITVIRGNVQRIVPEDMAAEWLAKGFAVVGEPAATPPAFVDGEDKLKEGGVYLTQLSREKLFAALTARGHTLRGDEKHRELQQIAKGYIAEVKANRK